MLGIQLLASQEVGRALVPDDAGDILQAAVNRLLGGVKTKQASSIFAGQNSSTASPLGSPTAESPKVAPAMTLEEWLARHGNAKVIVRKRITVSVPESQIALPL